MAGVEVIGEVDRGAFWPADRAQHDILCALPRAKQIRASFTMPRNPRQHRLLWALLTKIAENNDSSPEANLSALKVLTGHAEFRIIGGQPAWIPKSISYSAMSQAEFGPWFDKALTTACEHLLPGVVPDELSNEIFEMTGIRA